MLARRERGGLRQLSDPFVSMMESMRDLQNNMTSLFGDLWRGDWTEGAPTTWAPSIDMYREGDNYVVECSVPGVRKEDVDITLDDNILNIRGHMRKSEEVKEENYHMREMRRGMFQRSVQLPDEIDPNKVSARIDNGLLRVTLTPTEQTKRRQLKVNVE